MDGNADALITKKLRGSSVEAPWKLRGSSVEAPWKLRGSSVEPGTLNDDTN